MPAWALPERQPGRWVLRSDSGRIIAQMPDGALYFEQTYWPWLDQAPDFDDLEGAFKESMWTNVASPPGPITAGPDGDRILVEGAKRLRASTDRAIIGLFGGNLLEIGQFLFRNDNFFVLLANEPEQAAEFLDRLTEHHLREPGALPGPRRAIHRRDPLRRRPGDADRAADLAAHVSQALQAAPRAHVEASEGAGRRQGDAPLVRRPARAAARPDRRRAGHDQPGADHLQGDGGGRPQGDFGDRITFWGGGCDTRDILPHGTPDEIKAHVREQIRILSPGGGFVFQQVHNIMADVPPENVVAMFEAACEWVSEGREGEREQGRKGDAIRTTQYASRSHV